MQLSEVVDYLRSERLGVLGTLSPTLTPQGALVGYAVTRDLKILFDTVRTSRKYANLLAHPRVSFTVGNASERTVQYEGEAEELSGDALARLRPLLLRNLARRHGA